LKDKRVEVFRGALESLIESLDATARIVRWNGAEAVPEPLERAALLIDDRLGMANRIAANKFSGSQVLADMMSSMSDAVRRLDAAYIAYRHRLETTPTQRDDAANFLDQEIGEVRADAHRWS
jgi:hypothetical protein